MVFAAALEMGDTLGRPRAYGVPGNAGDLSDTKQYENEDLEVTSAFRILVGGWTNPFEKYARQNGFIFSK